MQSNKIFIKPVDIIFNTEDESYSVFGYLPNSSTVFLKILTKNIYKVVLNRRVSQKDIDLVNTRYDCTILAIESNIMILYTNEPIPVGGHISEVSKITIDVSTFLKVSDILPYHWIEVSETYELSNKVTFCDYNLCCTSVVVSKAIIKYKIPEKTIFWSVNTLLDDSTKSMINIKNYNERSIYTINMIICTEFCSECYIITYQDIDIQKINNINYIRLRNERELISWFFNIVSITYPDNLVSFDSIDVLVSRMIHLQIDSSVDFKIIGQPLILDEVDVFDDKSKKIIKFKKFVIKGISNIDLYLWAIKFKPYLFENIPYDSIKYYKDLFVDVTMNKYFFVDNKLVKKSTLKADNKILRSKDKGKTFLLLQENFEILKSIASYCASTCVIEEIKETCNKLQVTVDDLLIKDCQMLIDKYYSPFVKKKPEYKKKPLKIFKKGKQGVYLNCYMYLLDDLYNVDLPGPLRVFGYHSGYVKRTDRFKKLITELCNQKEVLFMNPWYLISSTDENPCLSKLVCTKQIVTFRN